MLKKITIYEFLRIIRSKTYILSLIIAPLIAFLPFVFVLLTKYQSEKFKQGDDELIYVYDKIDILKQKEPEHVYTVYFWGGVFESEVQEREVTVRLVNSLDEGKKLLEEKKLRELFLLDEDFREDDMQVKVYTLGDGSSGLNGGRYQSLGFFFHNINVLDKNISLDMYKRIIHWPRYKSIVLHGNHVVDEKNVDEELTDTTVNIQIFIPFLLIFVFFFAVSMSYDAIVLSVTREKRTKLIEILLSSVSVEDLLFGKVSGVLAATVLKMLIWGVGFVVMPYIIMFFATEDVTYTLPFMTVLYATIFAGAGVLLYGTLCAGFSFLIDNEIGAKFPMIGLVMISGIPICFLANIVKDPNGILGTFFSYFPLFSPVGMPVRLAISNTLPFYEILISLLILVVTIYLSIGFSARLFKVALAKRGEKITVKEFFKALKQYK